MGSNPAIPTKGIGVRAVTVLGADTPVGAGLVTGLARTGFDVTAVDDGAPLPTSTSVVIDAGPLRAPSTTGDLAELDPAAWTRAAEDPMRRALHVLQAAHRCLTEHGGRIVVLLPSLVMTGAAGVAAWAAAAEGYRSLAKAAARAWGAERIAIQCLLVPTGTDRPGLQPPARGEAPEVATVLAALLDQRLDALTGVTLAADGGVWMTA
ncbi:MAG TPA: hypothetical protein VHE57_04225 [Mycobacteriales bacterium]|nr:hypothetical protein [Mycobacteriales bacterium]